MHQALLALSRPRVARDIYLMFVLRLKPSISAWPAYITATPVIVARIITMRMTICKSAPYSYQYRGSQDGSDYWHPIQIWLANNVPVQDTDNQKDGDKP